MNECPKIMRLYGKFPGRGLDPVALSYAPGLGSKGLLPLPGAQVFDHAVRKHKVEAFVCELQPNAISDDGDMAGLQKVAFIIVQGVDVENRYPGFYWDTLPPTRQTTDIQDAHRGCWRNHPHELLKATPAKVRRNPAGNLEDGMQL